MTRTPTVSIIKAQIPVSDLNRTPTVSIIKDQIPVSDLSRIPTVSIEKGQTTVSFDMVKLVTSSYLGNTTT
jgi:hypothetical protein